MSLILIFAIVGAVSMIIVFFMLNSSPEGWQDESGFHYGTPNNPGVAKAEKVKPAIQSHHGLSSVYSR
jgi:hypothetical protein